MVRIDSGDVIVSVALLVENSPSVVCFLVSSVAPFCTLTIALPLVPNLNASALSLVPVPLIVSLPSMPWVRPTTVLPEKLYWALGIALSTKSSPVAFWPMRMKPKKFWLMATSVRPCPVGSIWRPADAFVV